MWPTFRIFLTLAASLFILCDGFAVSIARANDAQAPDSLSTNTHTPQAVRELTPSEADAFNLGRAVDLWVKNDLRGAIEFLQEIDISRGSSFDRADRAAFLLAVASLTLGDVEAFHSVADRAAAPTGSPYRRWIRYCQLVESGMGGYVENGAAINLRSDLPGAATLSAALLIELGQAQDAIELLKSSNQDAPLSSIQMYMQAMARRSLGEDATRDWQRLSKREPQNAFDADLVGIALIEVALARLEKGENASDLLQRVPKNSRHAPRASHMLGLIALDVGDVESGRQILTAILDQHPHYEARRDVRLALGGNTVDGSDWRQALSTFESAEREWIGEFESLTRLENQNDLAAIWSVWEQQRIWRTEIRLAPEALLADLRELADASSDLLGDPSFSPSDNMAENLWPIVNPNGLITATWDSTGVLPRHHPQPHEWDSLRELQQKLRHAASVLARQERVVEEQEQRLKRQIDYLKLGHDKAGSSEKTLADAAARLADMLARLDAAILQLEAARDGALLNIAKRTRDMVESLRQELLFIQAMRHFYVGEPNRPEEFPEGVPSPAELLTLEESLANEAEKYVMFFAEHYPAVIARSFDDIWQPRLTGDSRSLHQAILEELARSRRIGAALDSTIAARTNDPELAEALARLDELSTTVDSLRGSEEVLRREIAQQVAVRGRARLDRERESIDYHLADASYELAIHVATDTTTAEDITIVRPLRKQAIAYLDAFLGRYPESVARGEGRFRLADLQLMQARDEFQIKMAKFLGEAPTADDLQNRALAPFVDYQPAIALYQAILSEDVEYPHTDAVLFNLGMILSDDGQSSGFDHLSRLVREYPDSPNGQEAWLRMGSDLFDRKDFAGSVPHFEEAITGEDPSFTAIALYKLGWAQFENDAFVSSADAFRRLMDLYAEHTDVAKAMDLRDEAQEYFVHSLARSGGADAFRQYFDTLGQRDYESRILLSLAHLMRSVSLYDKAVECDELWLTRYADQSDALDVAERLVDTYRNWNKPNEARAAKLAYAERFLPNGAWYEANTAPELRTRAEEFARSAYRENAAHHHHEARKSDNAASWELALTNYEHYLTNWPDASDSHRIHYMAGEAASRLQQYPNSIDHFSAAAASDTASVALDATWQQVAVSDSWYRSTQASEKENGVDSLAVNLLSAGQEFLDRFPSDKRAADIVWRRANVAYAHKWYTDAAASFALMTERYPADPRASVAIRMSGDAHYQHEEYEAAGAAYERALEMAQAAGHDSLAAEFQKTIPLCYYKHAESIAATDTVNGDAQAAPLFARLAARWPTFEYNDLALYRAGLGFAASGSAADAASAWEHLLADYPTSEYARDSAIQIALVHEKSGNKQSAATAYERFSRLYAEDPDAPEALLKASDLLAGANDQAGAKEMQTLFMQRFPGETETVMEIREKRATEELAKVMAGATTLGALLATPAAGRAKGSSELQKYIAMATENDSMASPLILAQVDYLTAEEAYPSYHAMRLTQPLPDAINAKKKQMETLLELYGKCTRHGVAEYSRASAHRIGQVLVDFGDALIASERPSGLNDDDLFAYDEVLEEQSWGFYDRGADVWSELLQQVGDSPEDPGEWIARTKEVLWPRLAQRFLYRPEVDYPLVAAKRPAESKSE